MATGRVSKRAVDHAIPGPKDTYLWDEEVHGFGLKVTPRGRKVYLIQYRIGGRNGRTRRFTIGTHGRLTAEEARGLARRLLVEVGAGNDPAEKRNTARAAITLGAALERFVNEHVLQKLKPRTAEEYTRTLIMHVGEALRRKPVTALSRADISDLHLSMNDTPYQANRTVAVLSKFFNWCESQGLRSDSTNPCLHVQKFREQGRERWLSLDEFIKLGQALECAEADRSATPWATSAIRLLLFTGARLSEILTLKWSYVDQTRRVLRLPDSKTGKKEIRLSPEALSVLDAVPRMSDNPHVICGEKPRSHIVNLQKTWRRIRGAAELSDVRLHDLRHSYASLLVSNNFTLPTIGALLGHSQVQTTARYAHLFDDPLTNANDAVGRIIDQALRGSKTTTS